MNILKRASIVVKRQLGKSILLFLMIFIFASIVLGSVSTRNAMIVTEERLLMQIPSVATIIYESSYTTRTTLWRQPTREEIHKIGSLPYVRVYDFTLRPFFYSEGLVWPIEDNPGIQARGRPFLGRGVNHPEIADIETGIVELMEGRVFTQTEIDDRAPVVVIPRDIAQVNSLTVGSMITLENIIYNFFSKEEDDRELATQFLEVEIIGIVGRDVTDVTGDPDFFYMPFGFAEDILNFRAEILNFRAEELLELDEDRFNNLSQEIFQDEPQIDSLFVLTSPRDLQNFATASEPFLPENWIIEGIDESIFAHIIASMDIILQLADYILLFTVISVTITLTLVILLFLRDRQYEMGVYRALGDKKHKILLQIIAELGLIAVVAFIFAIPTGASLSKTISTRLFEQHLIDQINNEQFFISTPSGLELHNPGVMSAEEALELYDITLDLSIIMIFMSIGTIVTLISSTIPIYYVLKIEPKDLLLQAKIGY